MVIIDEADKIISNQVSDLIRLIYDRLYEMDAGYALSEVDTSKVVTSKVETSKVDTSEVDTSEVIEKYNFNNSNDQNNIDSTYNPFFNNKVQFEMNGTNEMDKTNETEITFTNNLAITNNLATTNDLETTNNLSTANINISSYNTNIICKKKVKKKRYFQMVFISATLNYLIKNLTNYCLTNNTLWVELKKTKVEKSNTNDSIQELSNVNYELPPNLKQFCIFIDMKQKFMCLLYMLLDCIEKKTKPVIFFSNHHSVEYFQLLLSQLYWPTDIKKTNIDVMRKEDEKPIPVINQEDEILLKKYLEKSLLEKYKEEIKSVTDKDRDRNINKNSNKDINKDNNKDFEEESHFHYKKQNKKTRNILGLKNINVESIDDLNDGSIYNPNSDRHRRIYLFPNVKIYILHAKLSKEDRIGNLTEFLKEKNNAILLCTDVVARGINFNSLNVVIQYDPPHNFEDYVHKVGRTARLNEEGYSYFFLLPSEKEFVNVLSNQNMKVQTITGTRIIKRLKFLKIPSFLQAVGREILYFLQNHFISIVKHDSLLMEKSTSAFLNTVSSYYSISKNLRNIFNVKQLHLGHLAFTFLLEKTPKEISEYSKKRSYLKMKKSSLQNTQNKPNKPNKEKKKYFTDI